MSFKTTDAAALVEIERLENLLSEKAAPIQDQLAMNLLKHGINLKAVGGAGKEGTPGGGGQSAMTMTDLLREVNAGTISKEDGAQMAKQLNAALAAKNDPSTMKKLAYIPASLPS